MRGRYTWGSEPTPGLGWLGTPTYAVRALLIANGAVFVVQTVLLVLSQMIRDDGLWHAVFDRIFGLRSDGLCSGMVWQPVTYMFLHSANLFHILCNMLALWMFGREVEEQIGSRKFLWLYAAGGLFGAACWLAFNWGGYATLLGASAAVYAVCIAYATLMPDRQITLLLFFILPVTLKAKWWAWVAVAVVAYGSLAESGNGVAHLAHLGGVVVGYVFIKWMGWGEPSRFVEKLRAAVEPLARPAARPTREKDLSPEEFISEKVDPILDKISREGIHSLTREERKILEQSQARMKERSQHPRR